jgi:hypothetical protein
MIITVLYGASFDFETGIMTESGSAAEASEEGLQNIPCIHVHQNT